MIFYFLKYLPIICFIYIGLSRWIKTSDKRHLRITAVGIFGVLIFLSQDNSSAVLEFTRLSPVESLNGRHLYLDPQSRHSGGLVDPHPHSTIVGKLQ
jgi:hypothetical protein